MTRVRNMGRILSAFLMLGISSMCGAQIYKYLGIEDGLSNRRIYRIQKDGRGYMWFLTQEGMDRYDGKRIRHYTVLDGNLKVAPQVNLNWLYTDTENTLWVVGRKGRIFHYDTLHDRFRMVYRIPGLQDDFATGMLCYAYMDRGDRIWLCQGDHIIRYDTRTGIAQRLVSRLRGDITAISETDGTNLFIGTVNGLFPVRERDGVLEALADTDSIRTPVSELYYHPGSKKLFVGTFRKGILVYGVSAGSTLRNVAVNRITPLNDRELLIATGGRGVYRMDMDSLVPKPYITADYASHNGMNGDNINDIYVDGGDRIWLANYPAGVTIRNNRYQSYEWFRHSPGNSRSLVNDQVHDVIEDSEGDLWFATSNGISLLQPAVGRWRSFLSRSDGIQDGGNHIFLTLCEVSPGVICAGGYASGLYRIEKKTGRVEYFPPSFAAEGRPDQYINDIGKDSGGCIWTGGCHNLKRFDPHDGTVRLYPVPGPITAILEKAPEWMWIGTGMGLYLLDGHGGTCRHIAFPVEAVHVYALYQAPDGLLYIGTGGAGLLVYDSVEDNDDLRTYLEGLLKEEYLVQTCSNGRDALLVAREYNPDLILSDVMMPEMGGDELCASVKSDIETSHIPVMLLTALGDEKDMLEGLENGADAYITKPFSINVLRANIRNILANRALLKRAYAGLEDGVGQVPPDCHNTRDWKFMASVRECVMKNIDNPGFCVDMLCGMQNMSRTGFFNKLKALTGHAPADYIRSMRLQYAAQLLREKDCSITEISDDSGFSDVRYFREVFRKYYGMSPSEYRNSMRG